MKKQSLLQVWMTNNAGFKHYINFIYKGNEGQMKNKKTFFILIIFIVLVALEIFIFNNSKTRIKESVTIEAGSAVTIDDFLLDSDDNGIFVTDLTTLDLKKPGKYCVEIDVNNEIFSATIEVADTIAPEGTAVDLILPKDKTVEASAFVTDTNDVNTISVSFQTKPDFSKLGTQNIVLILNDTSNNRKELTATLTIVNVKKSIQIEAGSAITITAEDFSLDGSSLSIQSDLSALDVFKPAIHEINILFDGKIVPVCIEIVDTIAPTATAVNKEAWINEPIEAISFLTDIVDVTTVTAYYKVTPDFNLTGIQNVTIVLEDASKNAVEKNAVLTVKEDTIPPDIFGLIDKNVYLGKPVAYKTDVFVTDNKDAEIALQVDSSKVNIMQEGTYTVTYTAVDSNGNTTTKTINVSVIKETVSEETLYTLVDEILAEITTEDMTKSQKAYAIYTWIRGNIRYESHSDITDWVKEAHEGITTGFGDCFTYYIVSEVMLNRVGIDNMKVTRVGGRSNHYWNLVNCGSGWYHFDPCNFLDFKPTFMLTDAQAAALTESRGINYYTFDESLYPRTPTEEFDMDEVSQ